MLAWRVYIYIFIWMLNGTWCNQVNMDANSKKINIQGKTGLRKSILLTYNDSEK